MQQFLYKLLAIAALSLTIFIVILTAGYRFDIRWIPFPRSYYLGGSTYSLLRLREAHKVTRPELLFIGSSHVERGFDPRIFARENIQVFNLGSPGQKVMHSYYLLKDYLNAIEPTTVVLDLYWLAMTTEEFEEPTIDLSINSPEVTINTTKMVLFSKDLTALNTYAYSLINRLTTPVSTYEQRDSKNNLYVEGGFTQTSLLSNELTIQELEQLEQLEVDLHSKQLKYIQSIVELCRENKVKLIFVLTPVTKEYKYSVSNYKEYIKYVHKIAHDENIPFLNYNEDSKLSIDSVNDFYDKNHLTQTGVVKFNEMFIQDYKSLFTNTK